MTQASCRCAEIQREDPLRHFKGCPLREPLPEGHLAVETVHVCSPQSLVLTQVAEERVYQDQKWGEDDDEAHLLSDWVVLAAIYLGRAGVEALRQGVDGEGEYTEEQMREFRRLMLKVAAVGVAAVEATDRNFVLLGFETKKRKKEKP